MKKRAGMKKLEKWHWKRRYVIAAAVLGFFLLMFAGMYGISRWYTASQSDRPEVLGVSFIPAYAESLGLDAPETMQALIDDVGVRHFRLVSYWSQLEPKPGEYDFSLLDWQFAKAEASGSKITLSLGLRQPRWPECHMPSWAANKPTAEWQPALEKFIGEVVERYKDSPALASYQLENEYFLRGFGTCTNFDRERLVSEYQLVKRLDPDHPVIISRSNNALGWPVGKPTPDEFGIAIYRRVWTPVLGRYINYPYPAWYYGFLGGWEKLMTGRDLIIHELQAEAWPPHRQTIPKTSLEEQNKSFNAQLFSERIKYASDTGLREIYLWGGEYWYYRLVKLNDPSLWQAAKEAY